MQSYFHLMGHGLSQIGTDSYFVRLVGKGDRKCLLIF